MEINNHFEHMPRQDHPGHMLYMPPVDPALSSDPSSSTANTSGSITGNLQSQFINLENYYRAQEDALVRQFESRRQLLAQEQMMMMQKRQQDYLEQQKQQQQQQQQQLEQEQMEQQEHMKQHKIQELKNKKKSEESAIASNEVKLKLRECLLNKNKHSPPDYRHWSKQHSSLEQNSPPCSGLSPPLRGHLLDRYDDEHPLRKTVSEPNLKMRSKILLRQMQRNSPLVQRRELMAMKKKNPLTIDTTLSSSNPDSGPNSPPSGTSQGSQGSVGETPPPLPKKKKVPTATLR